MKSFAEMVQERERAEARKVRTLIDALLSKPDVARLNPCPDCDGGPIVDDQQEPIRCEICDGAGTLPDSCRMCDLDAALVVHEIPPKGGTRQRVYLCVACGFSWIAS